MVICCKVFRILYSNIPSMFHSYMEETLILCWFIMAGSLWVAISRAMVFLEVGFLQISSLISEVSS